MFEISNSVFFRCPKTRYVAIAMAGDDKVWCHRCRTTHLLEEMERATAADMEAQMKQFLTK